MKNSGLIIVNFLCLGFNIGMCLLQLGLGHIALGIAHVFAGVVNIAGLNLLLRED